MCTRVTTLLLPAPATGRYWSQPPLLTSLPPRLLQIPAVPSFPHTHSQTQRPQVFVESLDRCFENVCELDLIFQFDAVHCLLNSMVVGGYVQETNIDSIASLFDSLMKTRKASVQAGSITNSLPDISLGGGGPGSWSDRLTRGLGRGRLGR